MMAVVATSLEDTSFSEGIVFTNRNDAEYQTTWLVVFTLW